MTVICFRDGVLAADRLITDHWEHRLGDVAKIFRTKTASYGYSGYWGDSGLFKEWVRTELDPTRRPQFNADLELIRIDANGAAFSAGKTPIFQAINAPFFALGSGRYLAMGAMAFGATAEEAVRIAIQYDTGCGGEVDVIRYAEQPNQYRPDPAIRSPVDDIHDIHFGGPR
jgi:hypothetical protein